MFHESIVIAWLRNWTELIRKYPRNSCRTAPLFDNDWGRCSLKINKIPCVKLCSCRCTTSKWPVTMAWPCFGTHSTFINSAQGGSRSPRCRYLHTLSVSFSHTAWSRYLSWVTDTLAREGISISDVPTLVSPYSWYFLSLLWDIKATLASSVNKIPSFS